MERVIITINLILLTAVTALALVVQQDSHALTAISASVQVTGAQG